MLGSQPAGKTLIVVNAVRIANLLQYDVLPGGNIPAARDEAQGQWVVCRPRRGVKGRACVSTGIDCADAVAYDIMADDVAPGIQSNVARGRAERPAASVRRPPSLGISVAGQIAGDVESGSKVDVTARGRADAAEVWIHQHIIVERNVVRGEEYKPVHSGAGIHAARDGRDINAAAAHGTHKPARHRDILAGAQGDRAVVRLERTSALEENAADTGSYIRRRRKIPAGSERYGPTLTCLDARSLDCDIVARFGRDQTSRRRGARAVIKRPRCSALQGDIIAGAQAHRAIVRNQ